MTHTTDSSDLLDRVWRRAVRQAVAKWHRGERLSPVEGATLNHALDVNYAEQLTCLPEFAAHGAAAPDPAE